MAAPLTVVKQELSEDVDIEAKPHPANGKSESALRRRKMKEENPEKYKRELEKAKERYRRRKQEREQRWSLGTRSTQAEREEYYQKRRLADRQNYSRKKAEGQRQTRTSLTSTAQQATPGKRRCEMSDRERKAHDNKVRQQRKASRCGQKKHADKQKEAKYRREYRAKKKLAQVFNRPQPGPASASPPTPGVSATVPASPSTAAAATLPFTSRGKMRQHRYNISSLLRNVVKRKKLTETEEAQVSASVVLRRTPQKRVNNINAPIDNREVQLLCQKKPFGVDSNTTSTGTAGKQPTSKSKERARSRRISNTAKKILLRRCVQTFFKSECVARQLPHCRYATKADPGFALLMTLQEAYDLFRKKYPELVIGFSTFAELRPKEVRKLGTVPVETCLCVLCTNVGLKVGVLNKLLGQPSIPKESQILHFVMCPYKGDWPKKECIEGECPRCSDLLRPFTVICQDVYFEEVSWSHWERIDRDGKMKLEILHKSGTVSDLFEELDKDLHQPIKGRSFPQHVFTAYWQKKQFDRCRDGLQQGQVMLLQDFVENRKATYGAEVKSAHFSKQQISLHPTVCYFRDAEGQLIRHVHMFFSDDITHDYHAVHQYTLKSIELLQKDTPVKEVIVWSDGAASQYKGKGSFADLTLYPFQFQRNYFGSGHSEGEADGETGRFAQAIRRAVARGTNFKNAKDMAAFGASIYPTSNPLKKCHCNVVPSLDIRRDRPETDVETLPGSRSLHQAVKLRPYLLKTRKLSCFCTGCVGGQGTCAWAHILPEFETFKMKPRIIELCTLTPKGITDDAIKAAIPQCDIQQRVIAVNRLLSTNRIELLKSGAKLLYKLKDPDAASQIKGADTEEKVVFQIIKDAQNKGIWTRDIRIKSNLKNIQVLNKILKNLESKKLIKAVKSVNASKKKVYMLYNLEPDQSVTGGPWYSASEFESEFVEILNLQAHKFLQQKALDASKVYPDDPWKRLQTSYASAENVLQHITNLGISKVNLSEKDMESILDTLIFDGKAELSARTSSTSDGGSVKIYRNIQPLTDTSGLVKAPCGVCPVISRCTVDGLISPKTCVYMKDWLDF